MSFSKFIIKYPIRRSLNYSVIKRLCSNKTSPCADKTSEECKKPEAKAQQPSVEGGSKEAGASEGMQGLVLGVYEAGDKFELTKAAKEFDQQSGGKLCQKLAEHSCQLKLGKAITFTDITTSFESVAIASYGPKDPGYNVLEHLDEGRENIRWGVGAGVRLLKARGVTHVVVDAADHPDAAAEAAELAGWEFQEYKSSKVPICKFSAFEKSSVWDTGVIHGNGQNWARYLSDMPANDMTPIDLAQAALDMLCPLGVRVTVRELDWLRARGMQAFLAVARGSCAPPVLLECEWGGAGGDPPVLIAAKGVTFDCGGLCLKCPDDMRDNRGSMAGAAAALAALKVVAELKTKLNVTAVIPLCENMISGQCMKVGDIVPALNGKFIQIEDTDMEGRLMLADALVYGQSVYKPSCVIDIGTMTKGVWLATGGGAYGCVSNSDCLYQRMRHAGASTGDRPWRFPLWDYYHKQITNDASVDLRNKGSGRATPCIGAAFLKNFICGDWLHLDITGVAKLSRAGAPPYLSPRRMSGRPARAVARLLQDFTLVGGLEDVPKKATA